MYYTVISLTIYEGRRSSTSLGVAGLRYSYRGATPLASIRISNSIGRGLPCHGSRCRFDAGLVRLKEKSPKVR